MHVSLVQRKNHGPHQPLHQTTKHRPPNGLVGIQSWTSRRYPGWCKMHLQPIINDSVTRKKKLIGGLRLTDFEKKICIQFFLTGKVEPNSWKILYRFCKNDMCRLEEWKVIQLPILWGKQHLIKYFHLHCCSFCSSRGLKWAALKRR